jgi:hypothetical protein
MKHYSKVIIELPDGLDDPPYAVVSIDCDVCGEEEIRIPMQHLGTVLRVLDHAIAQLGGSGASQPMGPQFLDKTPENKAKLRDCLDRAFPGWKADRIRKAAQ